MADQSRIHQLVEAYLRLDMPVERYLESLDDDVRDDVARALTVVVSGEQQQRLVKTSVRPKTIGGSTILDRIGAGAMGEVFRAHQLELDRVVAVKLMRIELAERQEFLQRFRSESRLLARLDHPGIVKVLTSGEQDGWLFFTMDFVAGRDLAEAMPALRRELVEADGPRRWDRIVRIVAEILDALAHAHLRGVVHRDLKPSNVVVDTEGRPHIVDFGLAKSSGPASQTTLGMVAGTPAYMSPELAEGRPHPREQADLWAVGVMLYEAVVGAHPYQRESLEHTLQAVRTLGRVDLRVVAPQLPRPLRAIVERALAPDWQERYANARLFAQDLRNFLDDQPVVAEQWSLWTSLRHHLRRRRRRYLAAASALFTAGIAWLSADAWAQQRTLSEQVVHLQRAAGDATLGFAELGRHADTARALLASGALDREGVSRTTASLREFERRARQRFDEGARLVEAGAGSRHGASLGDYRAPVPAVMWAGLHAADEARHVLPSLPAGEELLTTSQPLVVVQDPDGMTGVPLRIHVLDDLTGQPMLQVVDSTTPWAGSLPQGRYRITVGTQAAFAECARTFWQPGEHVVTPILRETQSLGADLIPIAGGNATIGQTAPGATVYAQTVIAFGGFQIERTEVTCAVYHEYCQQSGASLPSSWDGAYDPAWANLPVHGVSFVDATACAEWRGMRLPSAAEWQIAAAGLQGAKFPWGNEDAPVAELPTIGRDRGVAWVDGLKPVGTTPLDRSWCDAYDMLGNVYEWTETPYVDLVEGAPFAVYAWRLRYGACWLSDANPDYVQLQHPVPGPPQAQETGFRCAKSILP
ncbi:MAG: bifunctional serine/threonine-protein kinase/formylglycine-generating enzyme family protein [Planctomycetota bacterium]